MISKYVLNVENTVDLPLQQDLRISPISSNNPPLATNPPCFATLFNKGGVWFVARNSTDSYTVSRPVGDKIVIVQSLDVHFPFAEL